MFTFPIISEVKVIGLNPPRLETFKVWKKPSAHLLSNLPMFPELFVSGIT